MSECLVVFVAVYTVQEVAEGTSTSRDTCGGGGDVAWVGEHGCVGALFICRLWFSRGIVGYMDTGGGGGGCVAWLGEQERRWWCRSLQGVSLV